MDIILSILGIVCFIAGIIGCFAPVLPGPPLSYIGLLLFHWTTYVDYSMTILWVLGIITVVITIADNFLPVLITKKMGGTKYGTWGAAIGIIVGLFLGPWGVITGPFLGALAGEFIAGAENKKALKSAFGSFLGFLLGTGAKLTICIVILYFCIVEFF